MDNNISVLRIYFRYGQKAQNQSFWQKLWNNNLGQQLLKKAKEMNIEQANIFQYFRNSTKQKPCLFRTYRPTRKTEIVY